MIDIETKLRSMTMANISNDLQAERANKINIAKHLTPTKIDGFKFPRPANIPLIRPQSSSSNCGCSSDSDTPTEDRRCKSRHRVRRTCPISIRRNNIRTQENLSGSPKSFSSCLPPIGVFWDIENCNVPRGCSAVMVAQVIRTSFFEGYREAEFIVVCDVTKEHSKVIEELNDAQVSLVHVPSLHKNAADEKLRQAMRRFADTHGAPAAIVLITSDINFIADVCDLRHRHKIHVILLHRNETAEALLVCANEAYNIETVFGNLPQRDGKTSAEPFQLTVSNLPLGLDGARLRNRLKRVSDNCGGRVVHLQNTIATLTFTSKDLAQRAQKRMQGADVFGHKICVGTPVPLEKENGKSETEDLDLDLNPRLRPGSESPQVMASSDETRSSMSQFAGAFGNAGSNLFGEADWSLSLRSNGSTAFRNVQVAMEYNGSSASTQSTSSSLNQLSKKLPLQNGHANGGGATVADATWQPGEKIKFANGRTKTPDQMRSIVKTRHDRDDLYVPPRGSISIDGRGRSAFAQPRKPSPPTAANGRPLSSPFGSGSSEEDQDRYFPPISAGKSETVELHVTNLDQGAKLPELKAAIHRMFSEHVSVIHVAIMTQSDGTVAARVKVASVRDAQLAIAQFHRRKFGRKRLLISQPGQATGNLQLVRSRIISLLGSMPGQSLPLVTFFELFESRFCTSASLADIHKLKDVCTIVEDDSCARAIRLNPGQNHVPSQTELGQCPEHGSLSGRADAEDGALPAVFVSLPTLRQRAHGLVMSHGGSLPLASIARCHEALYGPVPVADGGVPLEHLLGCVAGVEIHAGGAGKVLRWAAEGKATAANGPSPRLAEQQTQLSREIVELLKKFPRCQLPFGKLIPAYHHHFSRQCRVADYGFTKLADLLESMPHVVQVIGIGERREVTLSHRAQVRRFTADVLRMLKAQASRQVTADEFAEVYQRATGREWDVFEYGVCELSDLLDSLNETAVTVTHTSLGAIVSIPRRTQTPAEIANTTRFAGEVVEMLWLAPQCRIPFTKFVPAYHHFFRRQCRVADMGFNKLIELLEAIGHVAQVTDDGGGERYVTLGAELSLSALSQQLCAMLTASPFGCMLIADIPAAYKQRYGFALCPETHGCSSLLQLMHKLRDTVVVSDSGFGGPMARALDSAQLRAMSLKAWRVLVENGAATPMAAPLFLQAYWRCHREVANLESLTTNLSARVKVYAANGTQHVCLTPPMVFAAEAYRAILAAGGSVPWADLERSYRARPGNKACADLADAVADVIAVGVDGQATLQPALADAGMRLVDGLDQEDPSDAQMTTFTGNSLLGGFPLHKALPSKESVKAAFKAETDVWNQVPKKRMESAPFPSCLEPRNDYVGLPILLPTMSMSTDVKRSLLELTSPAKSLLPAHLFPHGYESPSASKLPMPTALRSRQAVSPPSDAGHNGDSGCGADLDSSAGSAHGSAGKHKRRLAAQFPVAVDM